MQLLPVWRTIVLCVVFKHLVCCKLIKKIAKMMWKHPKEWVTLLDRIY